MYDKMKLILREVREWLVVNDCDFGLYVVRILNSDENYAFNVVMHYDFEIDGKVVNETLELIEPDRGTYTGHYKVLAIWGLQDVKG